MKLYYSKGACSLAIRIIINELGITSEYEAVNLKTKETEKGESYFAINPKGSVPAILDNGELITENTVIQQYLADKYNATMLLPLVGEIKRYRVLEWLNFISTDLHKSFSPLFNPALSQEIKDSFFVPIIKNKFNFIENHLVSHQYLMGESFTLPDAYLFVILTWTAKFNIDIHEWSQLSRYFDLLKNRASVQKSLREEGI